MHTLELIGVSPTEPYIFMDQGAGEDVTVLLAIASRILLERHALDDDGRRGLIDYMANVGCNQLAKSDIVRARFSIRSYDYILTTRRLP
mgnify:CR=1 FL=1